MTTTSASSVHGRWVNGGHIENAGRRLVVATVAGALSGLLVGGVAGRLAMMLLARLTPEAAGIRSDDGFVMGQLTFSGTLSLLVLTTILGVLGGGIYWAVRSLMVGPRWFQVLSISVGPAIVVGAVVVHPEGVDFTFLRPAWLAIALFVAIPGGYAALLTVLGERWLKADSAFMKAPRTWAFAPLILWLPLFPVLLGGIAGWLVVESLRRQATTRALVEHPSTAWLTRVALTVIFSWSLVDLVADITVLT